MPSFFVYAASKNASQAVMRPLSFCWLSLPGPGCAGYTVLLLAPCAMQAGRAEGIGGFHAAEMGFLWFCQLLQERLQPGGNTAAAMENAALHGCHGQIFGIAFIQNAPVAPEGKYFLRSFRVGQSDEYVFVVDAIRGVNEECGRCSLQ